MGLWWVAQFFSSSSWLTAYSPFERCDTPGLEPPWYGAGALCHGTPRPPRLVWNILASQLGRLACLGLEIAHKGAGKAIPKELIPPTTPTWPGAMTAETVPSWGSVQSAPACTHCTNRCYPCFARQRNTRIRHKCPRVLGSDPLLRPVAVDPRISKGSIPPTHLAQELTLVISGPSVRAAAGDDGDRSVVRVSISYDAVRTLK